MLRGRSCLWAFVGSCRKRASACACQYGGYPKANVGHLVVYPFSAQVGVQDPKAVGHYSQGLLRPLPSAVGTGPTQPTRAPQTPNSAKTG